MREQGDKGRRFRVPLRAQSGGSVNRPAGIDGPPEVVYARFVALRRGLVLFALLAPALPLAARAAAKDEPKAKFKVVSATGRQTLSFHEDSKGDFGNCVGSTA